MIKEWWSRVPWFSRFVLYCSTFSLLLLFFSPSLNYLLVNIPPMVIFEFQFFRLFTSPFIVLDLFQYLFAMLSFLMHASREERRLGTCAYAWRFMLISKVNLGLLCQGCFIGVYFLSDAFLPSLTTYIKVYNSVWPVIMAEIVIECMREPDGQRRFWCLPCMIQNKYYPLIFLLMFGLIFPSVFFTLGTGSLIGFACKL
jgi:hypothetical protein